MLYDPVKTSIFGVLTGLGTDPKTQEADIRQKRYEKLKSLMEARDSKLDDFGYIPYLTPDQNIERAIRDHRVYTDPVTGEKYQESVVNGEVTRTPFTGPTRTFYVAKTQSGGIKAGLARDDVKPGYSPFEARYMDKTKVNPYTGNANPYDGTPGPYGVSGKKDKDLLVEVSLPYNYAAELEYGIHSDIDMIKNRLLGSNVPKHADALLGPGKSEYYSSNSPLFNPNYDYEKEKNLPYVTYDTYIPNEPDYFKVNTQSNDGHTLTAWDKKSTAGKMLSGLGAGALTGLSKLGELIVDGADAVTPDEYKSIDKTYDKMKDWLQSNIDDGSIDNLVGYNPSQVSNYGRKALKAYHNKGALGFLKEVVSDPESAAVALSNSLPEMIAMANLYGFGAIAASNLNYNLDRLEENARKTGTKVTTEDLLTAGTLSVISSILDRIGAKSVLGLSDTSKLIANGITKSLSSVPNHIKNEVLKRVITTVGKTSALGLALASKAAVEGATEGVQEILENKATDLSKLNTKLTQEEIDNAIAAAAVGMGAGGVGATATSYKDVGKTALDALGTTAYTTGMGLSKMAEAVTGKTGAEIRAKRQANTVSDEVTIDDLLARRINTDLINNSDLDNKETLLKRAEIINNIIDTLQKTDPNSPDYNEKINNAVKKIDTAIEKNKFEQFLYTTNDNNENINADNVNNNTENIDITNDNTENIDIDSDNNVNIDITNDNTEDIDLESMKIDINKIDNSGLLDGQKDWLKPAATGINEKINRLKYLRGKDFYTEIGNIIDYIEDSGLKEYQINPNAIHRDTVKNNLTREDRINNAKINFEKYQEDKNKNNQYQKDKTDQDRQKASKINTELDSLKETSNNLSNEEFDKKLNSIIKDIEENGFKYYTMAHTSNNKFKTKNKSTDKETNNKSTSKSKENTKSNAKTSEETKEAERRTEEPRKTKEESEEVKTSKETKKANKTKEDKEAENTKETNKTKKSKTKETEEKSVTIEHTKEDSNPEETAKTVKESGINFDNILVAGIDKISKQENKSNITITKKSEEQIKKDKEKATEETITDKDATSKDITDKGVRKAAASKKKNKLLPNLKINDAFIGKIFNRELTVEDIDNLTKTVVNKEYNVSVFTKRIADNLGLSGSKEEIMDTIIDDFKDRVKSALENNNEVQEGMETLFGENVTLEKALRVAVLVLSGTKAGMDSRHDINLNNNFDDKGLSWAKKSDIAQQIGKELLNSYEIRLAGKAENVAINYTKIGDIMLEIGKSMGLIEEENVRLIVHNEVNDKNERLANEKTISKLYHYKEKKSNTYFMFGPAVKIKDVGDINNIDDELQMHIAVAEQVTKLLKPINYELPTKDPTDTVYSESELSKEHEEIIKNYNKLKYSIKPVFIPFLKEIKSYLLNDDGSTAREFDKGIKNGKLRKLLGLIGTGSSLFSRTEDGRTINRSRVLKDIIESLDYILKDLNNSFHFNYESAINQRIHVMQTVLDYQGDKRISRQIITSGPVQVKTELGKELLLRTIAEELKIDYEDVITITKKENKDIKDEKLSLLREAMLILNEELKNGESHTIDDTNDIKKEYSKSLTIDNINDIKEELGIESGFKVLSLISALNDIYNAKNGIITTDYMLGIDSTASGVVFTVLNRAGVEEAKALIDEFGIANPEKSKKETIDPYSSLADSVIKKTFSKRVKEILKELDKIGFSGRDLAKYPEMKWIYGQSEKNNQREVGNDLADDIISKAMDGNEEALVFINNILKNFGVENTYRKPIEKIIELYDDTDKIENDDSILNITPDHRNKIAAYLKENLAVRFTNELGSKFKFVTDYREVMSKIFELLEKTGEWDGTLRTAMDYLLGNENNPYKMSVKKLKTVAFTSDKDGKTYTVNKPMLNPTSFNVNPQHASDAAALLMTLKAIFEKYGESFKRGIMTVHDAFYLDPDTAVVVMDTYNQIVKRIALEYDFVDAALRELDDVIKVLEKKGEDTSRFKEEYERLKESNDRLKEKKRELFEDKNFQLNIMGNFEVGQKLAQNRQNGGSLEDILTEIKPEKETIEKETKEETTTEPEKETVVEEEINTENEEGKINPKVEEENIFKAKPEAKKEVSIKEVYEEIVNTIKSSENNDFNYEQTNKIVLALSKLEKHLDKEHIKLFTRIKHILLNNKTYDTRFKVDKDLTDDGFFATENGYIFIPDKYIEKIEGSNGNIMDLTDPNTLIEILAHEIEHSIHLAYIKENFKDGKAQTGELRYLQRVITEKLRTANTNKLSKKTKARLQYILGQKDIVSQVAEFAAIIKNELSVRNEILGLISDENNSDFIIKKIIQSVINTIKNAIDKFKRAMEDGSINKMSFTLTHTIEALEVLESNAEDYKKANKSNNNNVKEVYGFAKKTKNTEDIDDEIPVDPLTGISNAIDKTNTLASDWLIIFGDTLSEHIGPKLTELHRKLKHNYPIYRDTVNLIRTGFHDTKIGQQFQYLIGAAQDVNDKVIKKALSLFDNYQKEIHTKLESMAKMDRYVNKIYNKDEKILLHRLFADTGIANLLLMPDIYNDLFNGNKPIEELIKHVIDKGKLDEKSIKTLDEIAQEWVYGNSTTNAINLIYAPKNNNEAYVYTTLKAISLINNGREFLVKMNKEHKQLKNDMMGLAIANKELNSIINDKGIDPETGNLNPDSTYYTGYDGHYSMDMYDKTFEYRIITIEELRSNKYSNEKGWIILRKPTNDGVYGLVARESFIGRVPGIGLNTNRYINGAFLNAEQSKKLKEEYDAILDDNKKEEWLHKNRLVIDGSKFRVLIDKKTKIEKLGLIQNAVQSLFRTFLHNSELIELESVRKLVVEEGTLYIRTADAMKKLNNILRDNYRNGVRGKFGTKTKVQPFIHINFKADELKDIKSYVELKQKYPYVAKYFEEAKGLTTFRNFNDNIHLVKKGVSDILLGHKTASIFGDSDYRELAKFESMFKKIIVLAKQKLAVVNPIKLAKDSITNFAILGTMGISPTEIIRGYSDGFSAYKEYAYERSKYVELAMIARLLMAEKNMKGIDEEEINKKVEKAIKIRDKQLAKLKNMEFHDAYEYGLVQSYSTNLTIKEFDSITGIQHDINNFIDKYTHDKKGNPNKLFKAIKWWQGLGFGLDSMIKKIGSIATLKNTDAGTELVELANRLKDKKDDKESVARYISDIIASPASEAVNYSSAYMVLADALSKYVLAKHLIKKGLSKEEAYNTANDVFIDYRTNLPAPIKTLSDYGILLFPDFWIKIQKTIFNLFKYHPVTTGASYVANSITNTEDLNIVSQSVLTKFIGKQEMFNMPGSIINAETFMPFL